MNILFCSCEGKTDYIVTAIRFHKPTFKEYLFSFFKKSQLRSSEIKFVSIYGKWYFLDAEEVKNDDLIILLDQFVNMAKNKPINIYQYWGHVEW